MNTIMATFVVVEASWKAAASINSMILLASYVMFGVSLSRMLAWFPARDWYLIVEGLVAFMVGLAMQMFVMASFGAWPMVALTALAAYLLATAFRLAVTRAVEQDSPDSGRSSK